MKNETPGRIRIIDIAREAGVSITAANKVLSGGSSNIRVGREKSELIRAIAKRLDYRPNIIARTLVGGKSKIIGVHVDSMAPFTYFRILAGIEHELSNHGYRTMISETHDNIDNIGEAYNMFMQYGADGIIMMSHNYPALNELERARLVNLVNTVYIGKPCADKAAFVHIDFAAGVEAAVKHLLVRGKRRIGLVIPDPAIYTIALRLEGFKRAVAKESKKIECSEIHILNSLDATVTVPEIFENFIQPNKINGLIMTNDTMATFMMRTLTRHGIRIPEEIAVIGQDNMEYTPGLTPSLTTIDENSEETARNAVELLMLQIAGKLDKNHSIRVVTPTLVVREST